MSWADHGWFAAAELRHSAGRTLLAIAVLAAGAVGIAFFRTETGRKANELRARYAASTGAGTILVDLDRIPDDSLGGFMQDLRALDGVRSVDAPLIGHDLGVTADVSALVFANDQQQEFLGARTTVLGVDPGFDPAVGYSVSIGGTDRFVALLPGSEQFDAPGPGEVLVPDSVASYIGLAPGAEVAVELAYVGVDPPVTRRLEGLRVAGTFQMTGPERDSVDPFWRLAAHGRDILTVRRDDTPAALTTVPLVLDSDTVQQFLDAAATAAAPGQLDAALSHRRIVVTAHDLRDVPVLQRRVDAVLRTHRVGAASVATPAGIDHRAALAAVNRIGGGAAPIELLLLALVVAGTSGIQAQLALDRWRTSAVLSALGYSRRRIVVLGATRFAVVVFGAGALIMLAMVAAADRVDGRDLSRATGLVVAVGTLASLPALVWPTLPHAATTLGER